MLNPLAHYDGVWFLRVTVQGYPRGQFTTFFPLYPLVVRGAGLLVGHGYELAGIVVSTVFFLAADGTALRASSRPSSVTGRPSAPSCSCRCFRPRSSSRPSTASRCFCCSRCCASGACGATGWCWPAWRLCWPRSPASPACCSCCLWRWPTSARASRAAGRAWARPAALLLPPLGLLGYCLYLWRAVGDPVAWSTGESEWGRSLAAPTTTVWHATRAGWYAVRYIASGRPAPLLQAYPGRSWPSSSTRSRS